LPIDSPAYFETSSRFIATVNSSEKTQRKEKINNALVLMKQQQQQKY